MNVRAVGWIPVFAALVLASRAGDLDPAGPPAPTMHTLEEIYQKLVQIEQDLALIKSSVMPVVGDTYLVIDLSDGPSATSYPVRYLNETPPGGWTPPGYRPAAGSPPPVPGAGPCLLPHGP